MRIDRLRTEQIDGTVTSAPVAAEHRLEVLGDDAPGRRGPVARLGRVAHDDRLDLLPMVGVIDADHGRLADRRVCLEAIFDLDGIDVLR